MFFKKQKNYEEPRLDIVTANSSFELKEAYNALVTKLLQFPIENKCKKIAVTSAIYGEGKTSVAINLAITLAANLVDKKILLIDADMRSSHVASFLDLNSNVSGIGLSDYLAEKVADVNVIASPLPNLSVIPAGGASFNPSGLILSNKMSKLLSECEENFDYIIIDTPPATFVSDAILLSDRVDGYVISTRAKYSVISKIASVEQALTSAGATIFGMILTDSKK